MVRTTMAMRRQFKSIRFTEVQSGDNVKCWQGPGMLLVLTNTGGKVIDSISMETICLTQVLQTAKAVL